MEPTLQELVEMKWAETGEKDRLLEVFREKLAECGWTDEMKAVCREFIKKKGRDHVTVKELVSAIAPKGKASVPSSVKEDMLHEILSVLTPTLHDVQKPPQGKGEMRR